MSKYNSDNNFVKHTSCEMCGSSDALGVYDDGHTYCYSCKTRKANQDIGELMKAEPKVVKMAQTTNKTFTYSSITDRKISLETCRKYGVGISRSGTVIDHHQYKYYNSSGDHVASKFRRTKDKTFWSEGTCPVVFCLDKIFSISLASLLPYVRVNWMP